MSQRTSSTLPCEFCQIVSCPLGEPFFLSPLPCQIKFEDIWPQLYRVKEHQPIVQKEAVRIKNGKEQRSFITKKTVNKICEAAHVLHSNKHNSTNRIAQEAYEP